MPGECHGQRHPRLGRHGGHFPLSFLGWGLFNTWPPLSSPTVAGVRFLPPRGTLPCALSVQRFRSREKLLVFILKLHPWYRIPMMP